MIKSLISIVIIVLTAFCVFVATQPGDFRISRSLDMEASPESIFAEVNDFHRWNAWSPWARLDPNAKTTFEGPDKGKGAIMRWAGNSDVGEGSMTIIESIPNEKIVIKLDFIKPMQGSNTVEFSFLPNDNKTTDVTWSMYGYNNFMAKAISLIFNCEKMVGGMYEKGLANLKTIVEK